MTITERFKDPLTSILCLINLRPRIRITKPHFGNQYACSIHTSSIGCQPCKPPSQWKHLTWSSNPIY